MCNTCNCKVRFALPEGELKVNDIVSFFAPSSDYNGVLTGTIEYVIESPIGYCVKINSWKSFIIHPKDIIGGYKNGSIGWHTNR